MGKIALSIVQSVDGYIADLDDQFDFIQQTLRCICMKCKKKCIFVPNMASI